jgi:hypothetical protein
MDLIGNEGKGLIAPTRGALGRFRVIDIIHSPARPLPEPQARPSQRHLRQKARW